MIPSRILKELQTRYNEYIDQILKQREIILTILKIYCVNSKLVTNAIDKKYNEYFNKIKENVKEKINVLRNNLNASEYRSIIKQRIINKKNKKTILNNISNDKIKVAVLNRFKISKYSKIIQNQMFIQISKTKNV